jgi:hypothetical protein
LDDARFAPGRIFASRYNAWYFGQSLVVLLLIGALATYGFFVALGGRPAFGVMEAR